jgi:hypothetical protein
MSNKYKIITIVDGECCKITIYKICVRVQYFFFR